MTDTPLYQRIRTQLRQAIEEGRYLPGERLPTEDELQASFGASRNTVAHAVHELVNEGLLYRVRGSGTYVRRRPATDGTAELAKGERAVGDEPIHFGIVADVGVPLGNPYVVGILEGLTRCLPAVNARAVFSGPWAQSWAEGTEDGPGASRALGTRSALGHVEALGRRWAAETDGMLIIAPQRSRLESLRVLERQHVPFVVVGARLESAAYAWHNVYVDNRQAMQEVVAYLRGLGHRRVAALTGGWESLDSADRAVGFVQACEAVGRGAGAQPAAGWRCATLQPVARLRERWQLAGDPQCGGAQCGDAQCGDAHCGDAHCGGVYWLAELADEPAWYRSVPKQVQEWMALGVGQRPTAIIAGGFALALATLRTLRQLGVGVPGQVSVVGFDDSVSAAYLDPPLTTVVQPLTVMGEVGGRALAAAIRHELIGRVNRPLAARLLVRQSAGPPPPDVK